MACEVICSEINAIVDTVVDGHTSAIESQEENTDFSLPSAPASSPPTILDLLFSILYNTEHGGMDDYRAGYFDKILSVLCRKRPAAMSTYINEGGGDESSAKINDDDEDDDEDAASLRLFRSRWPESSEGIDLLMASLLKAGGNEQDYELNLAESQNASEVLITMIQNSPLISPVLLRLTQEPMLPQIMEAASTGDHFSPHDNSLTCAMNVLESLILQLGGYGSVNTDDNGANTRRQCRCLDSTPSNPFATAKGALASRVDQGMGFAHAISPDPSRFWGHLGFGSFAWWNPWCCWVTFC
ncbi:hypothetical protein MHU86_21648 [Fragilaria crotonensis]|nr:hypothetical protein MHU86_21648 [Fragilaria crotonensis]